MDKYNSNSVGGSIRLPWFEYLFGSLRRKAVTRSAKRDAEISGSSPRTDRRDYKQAVESAVESSKFLCKILKENY